MTGMILSRPDGHDSSYASLPATSSVGPDVVDPFDLRQVYGSVTAVRIGGSTSTEATLSPQYDRHDAPGNATLLVTEGMAQFFAPWPGEIDLHIFVIESVLGLKRCEVADLLNLTQSGLLAWRSTPDVAARVDRLYEVAMTLHRHVKPARIPGILRTPDKWLDGRTILEALREEGAAPVLEYLDWLFSYEPL